MGMIKTWEIVYEEIIFIFFCGYVAKVQYHNEVILLYYTAYSKGLKSEEPTQLWRRKSED